MRCVFERSALGVAPYHVEHEVVIPLVDLYDFILSRVNMPGFFGYMSCTASTNLSRVKPCCMGRVHRVMKKSANSSSAMSIF